MTDTFDFDELSAHIDMQSSTPDNIDKIVSESLHAQVHIRNLENVSKACKNLDTPAAPSDNFMAGLMSKIDTLEPVCAFDFEDLSAAFDGDTTPELQTFIDSTPAAQTHQHNIQNLSAALQNLDTPHFEGFLDKVASALDSAENDDIIYTQNTEILSRAMQALPEFEPSANFMAGLEAQLDSVDETADANAEILSRAMQALPEFEPSANFMAGLEAQLDSVDETADANAEILSRAMQALPEFEPSANFMAGLEAQLDSVDETADANAEILSRAMQALPEFEPSANFMAGLEAQLDSVDETLDDNAEILSRALKALPEFEPSAQFMAGLEEKINPTPKAKIFALPAMFQHRVARMVAGFAMFGVLAYSGLQMVQNPQTQKPSIPTTHVMTFDTSLDDQLFVNVMEETDAELESFSENNYNGLIGG